MDERRAERGTKLRDAALEIIAADGVAAITVRGVCKAAQLTERYFYETYPSVEDLMGSLYDQVVDDVYASIRAEVENIDSPKEKGLGSIRALADVLLTDKARSRIFVMEQTAGASLGQHLERKREMKRHLIGELVDAMCEGNIDAVDREVNVRALMASQTTLFLAWAGGDLAMDTDRFVRHLFGILSAVTSVSSAAPSSTQAASAPHLHSHRQSSEKRVEI